MSIRPVHFAIKRLPCYVLRMSLEFEKHFRKDDCLDGGRTQQSFDGSFGETTLKRILQERTITSEFGASPISRSPVNAFLLRNSRLQIPTQFSIWSFSGESQSRIGFSIESPHKSLRHARLRRRDENHAEGFTRKAAHKKVHRALFVDRSFFWDSATARSAGCPLNLLLVEWVFWHHYRRTSLSEACARREVGNSTISHSFANTANEWAPELTEPQSLRPPQPPNHLWFSFLLALTFPLRSSSHLRFRHAVCQTRIQTCDGKHQKCRHIPHRT